MFYFNRANYSGISPDRSRKSVDNVVNLARISGSFAFAPLLFCFRFFHFRFKVFQFLSFTVYLNRNWNQSFGEMFFFYSQTPVVCLWDLGVRMACASPHCVIADNNMASQRLATVYRYTLLAVKCISTGFGGIGGSLSRL